MSGDSSELSTGNLLAAYAGGIFPMADSRGDARIHWIDPPVRALIPPGGLHVSRSLARRMRKGGYRVAIDAAFAQVVDACADRPSTWISGRIARAYAALHAAGHAHSLEIWRDGELRGGVYGVSLGGAFFGESMFSRETDASKIALAHLSDHLAACGFTLFDVQFMTPHLASLGAVEVSRGRYHALLARALGVQARFSRSPSSARCSAAPKRRSAGGRGR